MSPMKKTSFLLLLVFSICGSTTVKSQDLLDILDQEFKDSTMFAQATFKTTRLGFGHTIETRKKGTTQFTLGTRYWNIPMTTKRRSFVADRFSASFGIDYSFTNRFTLGSSITSFDGLLNLYGKYRLVRQSEGEKSIPIGLTIVQSRTLLTREINFVALPESISDRLVFTSQLILARKFNRSLSLQLVPTYIHSNTPLTYDTKDQFALGFGGRYRLSNHTSLFSEYYSVFGRNEGVQGYNSFFLGVNWELGYVIFQLSLSNAKSFDDAGAILYSPNNFNFNDGGLHFGVNVIFTLHSKKGRKRK